MSGRGEGLTCFSAFRGPFPPRGIIRAFKTPVRPSSAKTIARNRSGGQMGVLGRKNYAFLGGRSLQMSAADTFNAVCLFPLPEPFSFPTFQCQKLRLFLAHAAERVRLRGKFVHMALRRRRRRRRRRVVSRKKFRHDMNNHTVSQSVVGRGRSPVRPSCVRFGVGVFFPVVSGDAFERFFGASCVRSPCVR